MQLCASCQTKVDTSTDVCPACGRRFNNAPGQPAQRAASSKQPPDSSDEVADHSDLIAFARHANVAIESFTRHAFLQLKSLDEVRVGLRGISNSIDRQGTRIDALEHGIGALQRQRLSDAELAEAKLLKIDRDLQDFGRHAAGDRLRRLARSLRSLWSDVLATLPAAEDQLLVGQQLGGFAADVGLDVIVPRVGEAFDSRTITPVASAKPLAGGDPDGASVEAILAPGFSHNGEVVECARVRLHRPAPPRAPLTFSPPNGNSAAIRQEQLQ